MDFPFITNKIMNPTGNGPTFDEFVQKVLKEAEVKKATEEETKTASEATPECADGDPRSQCRGQVVNNDNEDGADSYQKGESVDGKPTQAEGKKSSNEEEKIAATDKEAKCGKEMGESDDAGKVTEEHTDAGPGNDENPDPKININNDPNYQKGESTNPGKVTGKNKKTEAKTKPSFKKIASLERKDKIKLFATLSSSKNNPIQYVEAMTGLKFANLTEEEKSWFKDFWRTMYPEEYVNEMVADR